MEKNPEIELPFRGVFRLMDGSTTPDRQDIRYRKAYGEFDCHSGFYGVVPVVLCFRRGNVFYTLQKVGGTSWEGRGNPGSVMVSGNYIRCCFLGFRQEFAHTMTYLAIFGPAETREPRSTT